MNGKIFKAFFKGRNVRYGKVGFCNAAVHFERTDCSYNHHRIRRNSCGAAFYVHKFFCTQICGKSRFRYNVISGSKRTQRSVNAVTSVGNVRKWSAVNECRRFFQSLHKIRADCIL